MTAEKRQEMKEYKEKALAYEQKLKGKRISLDSGVMTGSTEMQKLENYESPTNVIKELICSDMNSSDIITIQNTIKTDSSISPETPTLIFEKEHNSVESSSDKESINIKSENTSLVETLCDTSITKPELEHKSTVTNSTIYNDDNLNNSSDNKSISIKSANISLVVTPVPKNKSTFLNITNLSIPDDGSNTTAEQIPRLRSNSYTLSSPSPVMVAFLNSQVQQQLIEPKNIKNNIDSTKESKSEPVFTSNEYNKKVLKTKSISLHSITKPLQNQQLVDNFVKHKQLNLIDKQTDNDISSVQKQDDTKIEGNIVSISDGYINHNSVSESPCKSMKHCCCSHSDDEYSLSSLHYKTTEELNLEAEHLRRAKLEIERRHQEELANLIKKQREEQEQIAVRYYLVMQSTSETSMDDSHYSNSFSKQLKTCSSIQSEMTVTNDKSLLSDTSSIISNCSINTNVACSSPRQKTLSRSSPNLQQNIKFYHKMRGGLVKWTKAPTEVENSAATIINAGVRGYLTRRLLRTEKAQMLKKTILDSLKTALLMHRELKKQQPTESDLELHRRIINQVFILNINTHI
jgi:centrosomal protein CEP110